MAINIEKLNSTGFLFHKYDCNILLENNLEQTIQNLKTYIGNLISIKGENLFCDLDTIVPGQSILPHYHVINGTFQVVVWIPDEEFIGRDFLFGTSHELKRVRPFKGLMCFMKANDPQFIHGVSELLSSKPVKSLGFSSLFKSNLGNHDFFVKEYSIKKELEDYSNLI